MARAARSTRRRSAAPGGVRENLAQVAGSASDKRYSAATELLIRAVPGVQRWVCPRHCPGLRERRGPLVWRRSCGARSVRTRCAAQLIRVHIERGKCERAGTMRREAMRTPLTSGLRTDDAQHLTDGQVLWRSRVFLDTAAARRARCGVPGRHGLLPRERRADDLRHLAPRAAPTRVRRSGRARCAARGCAKPFRRAPAARSPRRRSPTCLCCVSSSARLFGTPAAPARAAAHRL